MKLLFDQNLSPDLPSLLHDLFPDSIQVIELNLDATVDRVIWQYAITNNFIIATKDKDYGDLSRLLGAPPKIILITSGNGPTSEVAALLRERYPEILALREDEDRGLLELR